MSEMKKIEVTFVDENILVRTIKEMGYNVEVHNEPIQLNNSYSKSKPKAHIVVSKNQFGGYGDVGFERKLGGGFIMHADDMDLGHKKFSAKKLNQGYSENIIKDFVNKNAKMNITRREMDKEKIKIYINVM